VIPFWRYDLVVLEKAHSGPALLASIKRVRTEPGAACRVDAASRAHDNDRWIERRRHAVASLLMPEQVLLATGAPLNRSGMRNE
jgi:hypothetical protein